jgi:hypothetical protein
MALELGRVVDLGEPHGIVRTYERLNAAGAGSGRS